MYKEKNEINRIIGPFQTRFSRNTRSGTRGQTDLDKKKWCLVKTEHPSYWIGPKNALLLKKTTNGTSNYYLSLEWPNENGDKPVSNGRVFGWLDESIKISKIAATFSRMVREKERNINRQSTLRVANRIETRRPRMKYKTNEWTSTGHILGPKRNEKRPSWAWCSIPLSFSSSANGGRSNGFDFRPTFVCFFFASRYTTLNGGNWRMKIEPSLGKSGGHSRRHF